MRKLLTTAAIAAALLSPIAARAADMPVKAVTSAFAYPVSGIFFGVNASVDAGTATTLQGVASTALYGGDIGVNFGYTRSIPSLNSFFFVEAIFDASAVQSGSNTANAILNVRRSADFEQRFAIGVPLTIQAKVLSLLGINDSFPSITGNVAPPQSYVFASTHEQDVSLQLGNAIGKNWAFSVGGGAGLLYKMPNGGVVDTWLEYRNGTAAFLVGPSAGVLQGKIGNSVKVGVSYKFGAVKLSAL